MGRMGKHAEAADRCDSFLSQRDDVTPEVTSLYLVLAEHCSQSERYDEAKKALKRALDDAQRLVSNGDVDARETKERAAVELARLKLRENDLEGARQLLGEASANEPLDVSVLRGCCDRDASKWAPLIPHLRRVSTEIGQGNEASCRAHERLAVLVECCSSCAGDDQEDVVRALLDGAARCAAARGSLKRPDAALCVISVLHLRVDGVERVPTACSRSDFVGERVVAGAWRQRFAPTSSRHRRVAPQGTQKHICNTQVAPQGVRRPRVVVEPLFAARFAICRVATRRTRFESRRNPRTCVAGLRRVHQQRRFGPSGGRGAALCASSKKYENRIQ